MCEGPSGSGDRSASTNGFIHICGNKKKFIKALSISPINVQKTFSVGHKKNL